MYEQLNMVFFKTLLTAFQMQFGQKKNRRRARVLLFSSQVTQFNRHKIITVFTTEPTHPTPHPLRMCDKTQHVII